MTDRADGVASDAPDGSAVLPQKGWFGRLLRRVVATPRDLLGVVGDDLRMLRRFPRFAGAVLVVASFPALYILIYLGGVWDPVSRTAELPVEIVNLDRGIVFQGRSVNVGDELAARLGASHDFGFRAGGDEASAHAAVERGDLAFAIVIPADFSANAVPGAAPGSGRIRIVLSEGNDYTTGGIARRFAAELGHQVNETLNRNRWEVVLRTAGESADGIGRLKDGVGRLLDGSRALQQGVTDYGQAGATLVDGMRKLGDGIRTIDDNIPAEKDLARLRRGAAQLAAGQRDLGAGLSKLRTGAGKLESGLATMQEKSKELPFGSRKVADGASQLRKGAGQIEDGLSAARAGSRKLGDGATTLAGGVDRLTSGVSALGDGIAQMAQKLPEDARLDEFVDGGGRLANGASDLVAGIEALDASIPADIPSLSGSADGLAGSVAPELEIVAPVATNGGAFAPSMLAVAGWVGVVVLANMFDLRSLGTNRAGASFTARAFGKFTVPALAVVLQSVVLTAALVFVLKLHPADATGLWLSTIVASLAFFALVFALLRLVGDAGKLAAVLLLALQLTASGGIVPPELTGDFYRRVHEWLPFTFAIEAFRAATFGAFEGNWQTPLSVVALTGLGALVFATFIGRWKPVEPAAYRPGLDI
ncbi:MAG: YhgE/Pip domain-containing protein [Rhizobiaceae bacterium]